MPCYAVPPAPDLRLRALPRDGGLRAHEVPGDGAAEHSAASPSSPPKGLRQPRRPCKGAWMI
eukprot:5941214-Heterocapsa_arctica.AAC.1